MLVDATLPLLARRGPTVTTAEIAAAAGVAEGTMFRVFPDKAGLLEACVAHALCADDTHRQLADAARHDQLEERLAAAGDALRAYFTRVGPLLDRRLLDPGPTLPDHTPERILPLLSQSVADLFAGVPAASLRATPELLGRLYVLLFAAEGMPTRTASAPLPIPEVVRVLLSGALAGDASHSDLDAHPTTERSTAR